MMNVVLLTYYVFFFSSRRRHTRSDRDWSSDVCSSDLGEGAREGVAIVEGFRGDVLLWLRLAPDGRIARCHARDPSWLQWPLLEAAIDGNIVADFPLCNK